MVAGSNQRADEATSGEHPASLTLTPEQLEGAKAAGMRYAELGALHNLKKRAERYERDKKVAFDRYMLACRIVDGERPAPSKAPHEVAILSAFGALGTATLFCVLSGLDYASFTIPLVLVVAVAASLGYYLSKEQWQQRSDRVRVVEDQISNGTLKVESPIQCC